jgi:Uma2 family endonuclease
LQRLPGEALPDGMMVKIDEHTAYQPDAVVHCDQPLPDDAIIVPAPVIVVEVLSPTTKRTMRAPSSPTISACRACVITSLSGPSGRR